MSFTKHRAFTAYAWLGSDFWRERPADDPHWRQPANDNQIQFSFDFFEGSFSFDFLEGAADADRNLITARDRVAEAVRHRERGDGRCYNQCHGLRASATDSLLGRFFHDADR